MTEERLENFITDIIDRDLASGRHETIVTRFPPEPNGYLHIGHAKSICLNFGLANQFDGLCNLRFDDTNPETEDTEYVDAIKRDVEWLGFEWNGDARFASNYFEQMYEYACQLIRSGDAYVDSVSVEEIREMRGTVTEPGTHSPFRDRTVDENLDLFERMRAGEFEDGEHVLRAKIDMSASNMLLRDPLLYRIRRARHHRTDDTWCIYPMYDFAHCIEDALEHVTHSLCTLEFENNRALYDWVLDHVDAPARPHQYEFARLNLDYTLMSKRKLRRLVEEGLVDGWDDPRMPTIAGLRRRGVTPEAIRAFCQMIGVARTNSLVDMGKLEFCIRDDLNERAPRVMCVLDPLSVVVTNMSDDDSLTLDADYWPHDIPRDGSRPVPMEREIFIERADFMLEPAKGYRRLSPGAVVRLRHGHCIRCDDVVQDADGNIEQLRCSYYPESLDADAPDGVKVQGVIHWVPASTSLPAEVRVYDRLFSEAEPESDPDVDFVEHINPRSLVVHSTARVEPSLATAAAGERFQFERTGYFVVDSSADSRSGLVFNRIVSLRDSWAKADTSGHSDQRSQRRAKNRVQNEPTGPVVTERDIARENSPALAAARSRLLDEFALDALDADIISGDEQILRFFHNAVDAYDSPQSLAKWIVNDVQRVRKDDSLAALPFEATAIARLAQLVDTNEISATAAKSVFEKLAASGGTADEWVESLGLKQISDRDAIDAIMEAVESKHPDEFARLRAGEMKLVGFLIGKVMQESRGKADPGVVKNAIMGVANSSE